ncbi:hypothetical protein [Levilactobacillus brevis]|uniref:hypothetical protein n=1 Tax=Levilactobacillus brevis TaxID=1580 RepID=UPI0011193664|nr:hypothetical protein [Levilactobacillus brevis]QCZ46821.1 Hypothetical protein UCCLB556_1946 [Levilactobacillus brevis]
MTKKSLAVAGVFSLALGMAMAITVPGTAMAKTKAAKVIKTTTLKKSTYKTTGGYIYSSAKLTKKSFNAGKYLSMTFNATKSAKVKKSNGKTATYYYVANSSKTVKGWVWKGNLSKIKSYAQEKKDIAAMKTIVGNMSSRAQTYIMPQFSQLTLSHTYSTDNAQYSLAQVASHLASEVYDGNQADVNGGIAEYQYFSGRFSSSTNRNLQKLYANYLDSVNGGDTFKAQRVQATYLARAMVDPIDSLQASAH